MVRLPPRARPLFPYLKRAYVEATRMAAPTTQLLSRARGRQLPTGVAPTLEQAASSTGGRFVVARAAEVVERAPVQGIPPDLPFTDTSDNYSFPAIGVAELPGGRVLGPHRAVVTSRGDLVQDVSWYFGTRRPREHPLFLNPFPGPPLRVDGRLGVLASRGDGNYHHFLMDVITRIGVLEQAPSIAMPDRWYVAAGARFQREILGLAGVPEEQWVDASAHPHVEADVLVVPAPPAMSETIPPWTVPWLRERLMSKVELGGPPRKLFITRGPSANNRTIVNEDDVAALLLDRGFEMIETGSMLVVDQIRAFSAAKVVVGPHGAALTNLLFTGPGTTAIELFPAGCLLPEYWRMSCSLPGMTYRYLSSPGPTPRRGRGAAIVRDIEVDIPALTTLLDEIG